MLYKRSRVTFHREEAHVAQLVEHVLGKDEVTRSIRVVGSSAERRVKLRHSVEGRRPDVDLLNVNLNRVSNGGSYGEGEI